MKGGGAGCARARWDEEGVWAQVREADASAINCKVVHIAGLQLTAGRGGEGGSQALWMHGAVALLRSKQARGEMQGGGASRAVKMERAWGQCVCRERGRIGWGNN